MLAIIPPGTLRPTENVPSPCVLDSRDALCLDCHIKYLDYHVLGLCSPRGRNALGQSGVEETDSLAALRIRPLHGRTDRPVQSKTMEAFCPENLLSAKDLVSIQCNAVSVRNAFVVIVQAIFMGDHQSSLLSPQFGAPPFLMGVASWWRRVHDGVLTWATENRARVVAATGLEHITISGDDAKMGTLSGMTRARENSMGMLMSGGVWLKASCCPVFRPFFSWGLLTAGAAGV